MNTELTYYEAVKTAEDLRAALNNELTKAAVSFIKIGYLLKLARDGEYLKESEYADYLDFAYREFGLDKSQVSRFININDRFSIGGYSEHLRVEYKDFGSSKLSIMLTLPDEINEELSPEYSKTDIQAVKNEYEEERKITDIEVMLEKKDENLPDEFTAVVVKQLNDEHPDPIAYFHETHQLADRMGIEPGEADVREAYMPDGDRAYSIRISGQGRFLVNMKEKEITVVNMRAPEEKSTLSWEEFRILVLEDEKGRTFAEKKAEKKPEKKKAEKKKVEVSAASKKRESDQKPAESVRKTEENVQKTEESDQQKAENVRNEEESDGEQAETVQTEDENAEKAEVAPVQPEEGGKASVQFLAMTVMERKKAVQIIKVLEELAPFLEEKRYELTKEIVRNISDSVSDLNRTASDILATWIYCGEEDGNE